MKKLFLAAAAATVFLWIGSVQASGPICVYALVDKVTFEPNAEHPERMQLSGIFILANGSRGDYFPAQKGYLYYSLPAQQPDQALREWADIQSVAGTRQVIGFGSSVYDAPGALRKAGAKTGSPDAYPIDNNGVRKVSESRPEAKALLDFKQD